MYQPLHIALVQMDCKLGDIAYNVAHALELAKEAVDHGADFICLPELFSTGYNLDSLGKDIYKMAEQEDGTTSVMDFLGKDIYKMAEPQEGAVLKKLKDFAADYQVYLMGCIAFYHTDPEGKPNISCFFIDSTGTLQGIYDKNHLFGDEKKYFSYGASYPVFSTEYGKIGIMVCYDANFPEPARILACQGAQIILCPAAWRAEDIRLFDMIMPQRAGENVAYVCAVNRYGTDDGRYNPGHSQICSPYGEVLAKAGEEETILYGTIDTNKVLRAREEIPYLDDLRYEEYLKFLPKK